MSDCQHDWAKGEPNHNGIRHVHCRMCDEEFYMNARGDITDASGVVVNIFNGRRRYHKHEEKGETKIAEPAKDKTETKSPDQTLWDALLTAKPSFTDRARSLKWKRVFDVVFELLLADGPSQ